MASPERPAAVQPHRYVRGEFGGCEVCGEAASGQLHTEPAAIRRVLMVNRCMVAGIASALIDAGDASKGDALLSAVRCCDEFPECAHVREWVETREEPDDAWSLATNPLPRGVPRGSSFSTP